MSQELQTFYDLIEDMKIAMMTTRRGDGHLVSRPMANQKRADGADLWFVTSAETQKLAHLDQDPHVNLTYFRDGNMEWISVSGTAISTPDPQKIHELYAADWEVWFPKEGDPRHGTADDPRLVLIAVTIHEAQFLEVNKPKPIILYEIARAWLTGSAPEIGEIHHLTEPRRPGPS